MAMHRDFLLGLACPPLHLWRHRRWVGVVLVGLVWLRGVTWTGLGLFEIVEGGLYAGLLGLDFGLLWWLTSGLLAWLWNWWPRLMATPLAAGIIGSVFLSVAVDHMVRGPRPDSPVPAAPPGLPTLRLILVTICTAVIILVVAWSYHRRQKRQQAKTKLVL